MRTKEMKSDKAGPRQRQKHYSYDENVDEAGKLIDSEPTDIEHAVPSDESEPVERPAEDDEAGPPAFED